MLEEIQTNRNQRCVFRFANVPRIEEFLVELGLDPNSEDEVRTLLLEKGHIPSIDELCDAPFRPKRKFKNRTRFSDGTFPVFYSSLELTTATAEVRHWFPGIAENPKALEQHTISGSAVHSKASKRTFAKKSRNGLT